MKKKYETPKYGELFGRWKIISDVEIKENRVRKILCECTCGSYIQKHVSIKSLYIKDSQSCGCLHNEIYKKLVTKHGMSGTKFYHVYSSMIGRCSNKNNKYYINYGGRGIKVCNEWLNFENFKNDMYIDYIEHINVFGQKDTTLDRIDVNGNYEPSNCKWSTQKEQQNNKTTNKIVIYENKEYTIKELSELLNIKEDMFRSRLKRGWKIEDAISNNKRHDIRSTIIKIDGKDIPLKQYAESLGYNGDTAVSYVSRYNISPEKSIEMLKNSKLLNNICYFTYNNKTYSIKQWCDILNLNFKKIQKRINILKWTVEEALELVERNKNNP